MSTATERPAAIEGFTGRFAWVDPHDLVIDPYNHRKHRRQATLRDDIDAAKQLSLMSIPKTRKNRHARAMGFKPAELAAATKASKLSDENLTEAFDEDFNLVEMAEFQEVEEVDDAL